MGILKSNFHPQHYQDLQNSGLSDLIIQELGIYSVSPSDISKKLGWNGQGIESMLAFPYPGTEGFERYKIFWQEG